MNIFIENSWKILKDAHSLWEIMRLTGAYSEEYINSAKGNMSVIEMHSMVLAIKNQAYVYLVSQGEISDNDYYRLTPWPEPAPGDISFKGDKSYRYYDNEWMEI